MMIQKPWLDLKTNGRSKILVEVMLNKRFPQKVVFSDKRMLTTVMDVVYSWLLYNCLIIKLVSDVLEDENCGSQDKHN